MKADNGKKYVGLTDDPETRKQQHGNPADWRHWAHPDEKTARQWEKDWIAAGAAGGPGGAGWRYGYMYTIRADTVED